MKHHKQKNLHDPDNGVWGDCYRTAIACLLDLEPEEVEHFMHGGPDADELRRRRDAWLRDRGYAIATFALDGSLSLDRALDVGPNWLSGMRYLLSGQSPRGTDHVVVVEGREIWDPAIPGGDLVGPCSDGFWWVEVLCPIDIHGMEDAA